MAILLSAATSCTVQIFASSFHIYIRRPNYKNKYVVKLTTTNNFVERAHLGVRYYNGEKNLKVMKVMVVPCRLQAKNSRI